MGKSKSRVMSRLSEKRKYFSPINIRREKAVESIILGLEKNGSIASIKDTISLFGISAEELAESGAKYEHIMALRGVLS